MESLPWLRSARTALAYAGPAAQLLQRFKFDDRRDGLPYLSGRLAARLRGLEADAVVPVPRHLRRLRELGADPVQTLARSLAGELRLPVLAALRRTRNPIPQTGLVGRARRDNVRGSFAARPSRVRGRTLLLLDDVTTTGATLGEAARSLRRAGARRVLQVALAGTPPPRGA